MNHVVFKKHIIIATMPPVVAQDLFVNPNNEVGFDKVGMYVYGNNRSIKVLTKRSWFKNLKGVRVKGTGNMCSDYLLTYECVNDIVTRIGTPEKKTEFRAALNAYNLAKEMKRREEELVERGEQRKDNVMERDETRKDETHKLKSLLEIGQAATQAGFKCTPDTIIAVYSKFTGVSSSQTIEDMNHPTVARITYALTDALTASDQKATELQNVADEKTSVIGQLEVSMRAVETQANDSGYCERLQAELNVAVKQAGEAGQCERLQAALDVAIRQSGNALRTKCIQAALDAANKTIRELIAAKSELATLHKTELEVLSNTIRNLGASIKVEAKRFEEAAADQMTELENKNEQLEGDVIELQDELAQVRAAADAELNAARTHIGHLEVSHARVVKRKNHYKLAWQADAKRQCLDRDD